MDIDLLSKMVKELILDNDRVVLPGLGSFVAEIVPSTFSDKGYTINPPYRKMYFRSKPNEGKELAELYADGNNVELAVAERIIADFVSELKTILYTKKAVVFPGLGRLRATKENNIFFIADENLDIYPAGFGLEPVSLKTHQETREEVAAAVVDLKSLITEPVPAEPESELNPKEEQAAELEPTAEPEAIPVPEPVPEQEPEPVPEPVPEQDSVPEPEPETIPESDSEPSADPEPATDSRHPALDAESPAPKTFGKPLLTAIIIIIALAVLMLVALAIIGRTNPEWIDRFLYTPEELKILNHIL